MTTKFPQIPKIATYIGFLGIFISIVIGIYSAAKVYIVPVSYFTHSSLDSIWIFIFTCLYLLVFSTFSLRQGKLLTYIILASSIFLIVLPAFLAGLWLIFLVGFWFLITASSLGWMIISRIFKIKLAGCIETLAISEILGLGIFALVALGMGSVGVLTTEWAYSVLVIISILTLPAFYQHFLIKARNSIRIVSRNWQTLDFRYRALAAGILIVCSLGAYMLALSPSIRWDSLSYHLAAPEIYIRYQRIIEISESYNTYWSHYAEMLFTFALLLEGQPLPGMLHFFAGFLTSIMTYLIGKYVGNTRAGLLAAILFLSLPIIGFEAGTAYNDLFVALFISATFYSNLKWAFTSEPRWLILTGIFAGFALGVKIYALLFILPLGIINLTYLIKKFKFSISLFLYSIYLLIPAILIFSPWAIRDFLWTGNPIFPLYNNIFNSPKWYPGVSNWSFEPGQKPWLANPLLLPWNMTTQSQLFYHEAPGGILGALPLTSLPWLFWHPKNPPHKRKYYWLISIYTLLVYFFFFSTVKNARYLIALYPLLAIITSVNLETIRIIWASTTRKQIKKILLTMGFFIAFCYILSTRLALIMRIPELPERFPYKTMLGIETPDEFLSRTIPVYDTFQYINQNAPQAKILSLGNEFRLYTSASIYGLLFSPATLAAIRDLNTEAELADVLSHNEFEYILVYPSNQRARTKVYTIKSMTPVFFQQYSRLVYTSNTIQLFRFYPEGAPTKEQSFNLLVNPEFEYGIENSSAGWQFQGAPILATDEQYVHSGNFAVQIFGPDSSEGYSYIFQDISVHPGTIYTIGYWIIGTPKYSLQMQVEWLDIHHQSLSVTYDWAPMTSNWQYLSIAVTSPPQAAYARVIASITGSASAWIDDLCFAKNELCLFP